MPVKLLNLDDRTFTDLVDEMRLLIPRHARSWTDHNYSDPGIMLVELFAWLTEAMLYRINRVPDASRVRLLEMLGAIFRPAEPATLALQVRLTDDTSHYKLWRRARVRAEGGYGKPVYFEVLHDVTFTPQQRVRTIIARQTQLVARHTLPQASNNKPLQLWRLDSGFLVTPPEPRPRPPQVLVDGEPWEYRPFLRESGATDKHFTFKPWLASLAFGNGQQGAIPADMALIKVVYRANQTAQGVVEEKFEANGQPWQLYRLAQQPLPLDLEKPDDLEPQLKVVEPGSPAGGTPWQFVTRFLDMEPSAAQYTFEPWYNAMRFGDGARGKIPAPGAQVNVRYRQTLGTGGNIPPRSQFSFWSSPLLEKDEVEDDAGMPEGNILPRSQFSFRTEKGGAEDDVEVPEESWLRVTDLEVAKDASGNYLWEISEGHDPTTLDDARRQVVVLLEPGWRAVTVDDFVSIVQRNQPEIARVVCLPGHDPAVPEPNLDRPGHVGIIVIPRATSDRTAPATELHDVLAVAANGLHLVASVTGGLTQLWNMNNRKTTELITQPPRDLVFSPDGLRLIVISPAGISKLWDTNHARPVTDLIRPIEPGVDGGVGGGTGELAPALTTPIPLSHALFSPDGQHLVTIYADDRAYLWESRDGVPLRDLGAVNPAILPLFSPDGHLLAVARDNDVWLWRLGKTGRWQLAQDEPLFEPPLSAPVMHMAFSPGGTWLAIAAADSSARLCRIHPENGQVLETLTPDLGQPVKALVFDQGGARLAAYGNDGSAALWSTRTGARLASLAVQGSVDLLAFSGDGRWLATAHRDQTVRCWSAASGRATFTLSPTAPLQAIVFSPSGHRLVTVSAAAGQAHTLQTWELRSEPGTLAAAHVQEVSGRQPLAIHASGRWLAYADERLVHVWDIETSKDIAAFHVDFDDPNVQMDGWSLVTPRRDVAASSAVAQDAPIRLTRAPYLLIASAVSATTKPDSTEQRTVQVFDAGYVYEADTLLATRRLVTSQHHVEGPTYTKVDIAVTVTRRTLEISAEKLAANIRMALSRFFDPLHGGPEGTGWPLGRPVHASEVYEVVEGVAGVDHVEHLALNDVSAGQKVHVDILPRSLVQCAVNAQVV